MVSLRPGGAWRRRIANRLLTRRGRTWSLIIFTIVLFGAAVLIGLPPQSILPTGLGRIIVLPVLPASDDARPYAVAVGWQIEHTPRLKAVLLTDTFWSGPGSFDSPTGLPLYLAVSDQETANALLACSAGRQPREKQAPQLTEVATLPKPQQDLLAKLDRQEFGGGSYRYLRVDDIESHSGVMGYPFAVCAVDPARLVTKDDVELHLRAPNVTVVAPKPTGQRVSDRLTPYVFLAALPAGWSPQDVRALSGNRKDNDNGIYWVGAEDTDPLSRPPDPSLHVLQVGSVTLEATSLNAARRAERALFWSGLLVGLAGSCLIMLFEALPWRTAPEEPTEAGPSRDAVGPAT